MTTMPASCRTSRSILRASGSSSTTMTRSGSSSGGPEPSSSCCDMLPPGVCPLPVAATCLAATTRHIMWRHGYETAQWARRMGTFVPHCRTGGSLGGSWGTARRPRDGVEASQHGSPPAASATVHDLEGVVPWDRARGNVATHPRELRVSCIRPRGGKSRWRVGYELPLAEEFCPALICARNARTTSIEPGGWGMVGEDADRGDSRKATRRGARGAHRHDLEAGSLASWSRALDERRRELLAGVGHELKTPLSIVLGLCGRLLATDELGGAHAQDVQRIRANAYVLLKRVDELLQVSRLDGGHLTLEAGEVDVAELGRSSCEGFASVAELRDQRLVVEAPAELRARVDEEKVLSVISNLVANALKHAPRGGLVRCSITAAAERLRIEVADDGPGVAAGLREEIFERYRRGAGSASRAGGTGLGLTIVRDLVALHEGTVTVTDAPEGGALFVVELPLHADDRGDAEPVASAPMATIDVAERQRATVERLRAELDADIRRGALPSAGPVEAPDLGERPGVLVIAADAELGAFVQEIIGRRYAVRHAGDPLDAARLIAARRPEAVLLDAAAGSSAIVALGRRLGETPLLALAASPEDVPELLQAGAHDCVVKPFPEDELRARLATLVERARAATRTATALGRLERAFQAAPVPMALISVEGRLVRVNRSLCTLLGYAPTELLERTVEDLTHPADLPVEEERRRLVLGRRVIVDRGTWRLARADGSYVRVSAATSLVGDDDGGDCLLWHLSDAPAEQRAKGGAGVLAGPPGR